MMTEREDILHDLAELAEQVIADDKRLNGIKAKEAAKAICERVRILWGGQPVYLKSAVPHDKAAANTGDNFLADVTNTAADAFQQAGLSQTEATQAAAELTEQTRHLLASQPVYIRKLEADYYTERDRAICSEFDGTQEKKRELCLKYGIGYHRLQQILKRAENKA